MKKLNLVRVVTCAIVAVLVGMMAVAPVLAHERREVGNYNFVVGFRNEPAFENVMNGIDLRVAKKDDAKTPVENLQDKLEVTVTAQGKSMPTKLRAVFRDPGHYYSDFIPTAVGDYTFHIKGKIEDQVIDETFVSGPGRFGAVESVDGLHFPVKIAAAEQMTSAISQAQTFGVIGMLLGLVGVALGGIALARSRK